MSCQPYPRPVTRGVSQLRATLLAAAAISENPSIPENVRIPENVGIAENVGTVEKAAQVDEAQQRPVGQQLARELVKLLITDIRHVCSPS